MDLSIIIVSWNVCKDVVNCINSIYDSQLAKGFEIILVDNDSSDDTVSLVRSKFSEVVVIESGKNLGFAAANNLGFKKARCKNILFLNPDTLVQEDAIDRLVDFIEANHDIGICGPKILNEDGTIQSSVRKFPKLRMGFYKFTILKYLGLFRKDSILYRMKGFDYENMADVDQLIGAALIARREVIDEVGGFDERFFMYYEEVDICKRIKENGLRCVYYPDAQIVHLGGHSSSQIPARTIYMNLKSYILYMKKHNDGFLFLLLMFLFKCGIFIRHLFDLVMSSLVVILLFWNGKIRERRMRLLVFSFDFLTKYYLKILTA